MRYNTGNPVGTDGSSDPRDLYDNTGIIDLLVTGPLGEYLNRLGIPLKSWRGIMQQVTDYLIAQGYESAYLTYGAGVIVQRQTQLVQRSGELYRVMNASDIPLTLTGTWATDAPKLQAVGDAALRQALASPTGAALIGFDTVNASEIFSQIFHGEAVTADAPTDLIIIYGQSNSVGIAANTPGYPGAVTTWARAFNPVANTLVPLPKALISSAGQTSTGHGWAAFGNRYAELGRKSVFVSCGLGGMALSALVKGGTIYTQMTAAVANAKALLASEGTPISRVIVMFNQGEQDSATGTKKYGYKVALAQLVADMVADFSVNHFGIQTLGSALASYGSDLAQGLIRSAQTEVGNEQASAFIATSLSSKLRIDNGLMQSSDGVHYTQLGYNLVGRDSAESTIAIVKGGSNRSDEGVDPVGRVEYSPRYNWYRAFAHVRRISAGYEAIDSNAAATPFRMVNAGLPIIDSGKVKIRTTGNNFCFGGLTVTPDETSKRYNLSAVAARDTYGADPAENGIALTICGELTFAITSAGAVTTVRNTAASNALVTGNLSAVVSGSTVVVTAASGVNFEGFPDLTNGTATGSISLSSANVNGFTITFTGGATVAYVRVPVVGLVPTSLPVGCGFSVGAELAN